MRSAELKNNDPLGADVEASRDRLGLLHEWEEDALTRLLVVWQELGKNDALVRRRGGAEGKGEDDVKREVVDSSGFFKTPKKEEESAPPQPSCSTTPAAPLSPPHASHSHHLLKENPLDPSLPLLELCAPLHTSDPAAPVTLQHYCLPGGGLTARLRQKYMQLHQMWINARGSSALPVREPWRAEVSTTTTGAESRERSPSGVSQSSDKSVPLLNQQRAEESQSTWDEPTPSRHRVAPVGVCSVLEDTQKNTDGIQEEPPAHLDLELHEAPKLLQHSPVDEKRFTREEMPDAVAAPAMTPRRRTPRRSPTPPQQQHSISSQELESYFKEMNSLTSRQHRQKRKRADVDLQVRLVELQQRRYHEAEGGGECVRKAVTAEDLLSLLDPVVKQGEKRISKRVGKKKEGFAPATGEVLMEEGGAAPGTSHLRGRPGKRAGGESFGFVEAPHGTSLNKQRRKSSPALAIPHLHPIEHLSVVAEKSYLRSRKRRLERYAEELQRKARETTENAMPASQETPPQFWSIAFPSQVTAPAVPSTGRTPPKVKQHEPSSHFLVDEEVLCVDEFTSDEECL